MILNFNNKNIFVYFFLYLFIFYIYLNKFIKKLNEIFLNCRIYLFIFFFFLIIISNIVKKYFTHQFIKIIQTFINVRYAQYSYIILFIIYYINLFFLVVMNKIILELFNIYIYIYDLKQILCLNFDYYDFYLKKIL